MMKKAFTLATALLCSIMLFAQGVNFQDLTYEEALQKAKAENKWVFVDCYTSWCGPCKMMADKIFPQKEAGDYFNPLFVCVKYDMEKGEGLELAKKFDIQSYPTFVILNSEGVVRQKLMGSSELDEFIERVKKALANTEILDEIEAKYNNGNRDKEFLTQYIGDILNVSTPKAQKAALELYQQLSDEERFSEKYWFLFSNDQLAPIGSKLFNFLVENHEKFAASLGEQKVKAYIYIILDAKLTDILMGRGKEITPELVDQMKKYLEALNFPTIGNNSFLKADIAKIVLTGNQEELLKYCEDLVQKIPGEKFPFIIVYAIKGKITPEQADRWAKVLQTAKDKFTVPQTVINIDQLIQLIKE